MILIELPEDVDRIRLKWVHLIPICLKGSFEFKKNKKLVVCFLYAKMFNKGTNIANANAFLKATDKMRRSDK